jgi:hypothetical protein
MGNKNDGGEEKKSLVCWFLTTQPTYAKDRNKKWKLAPARTVLWVDVSHAFANITTRAAPLLGPADAHGNREVIELYEVAINPKSKKNIGNGPDGKPRMAWQMDFYGGKGPLAKRDGYRTFDAKVIAALKNVIQVPEFAANKIEEFPEIDAGVLSVATEVLALPEHTTTVAPAN